jgi:ABC-2 type transport system permease protein
MKALLALLRKETYHILRDRRTLTVVVLMPVLQVLLFGYAIRTDVENIRLAIVDPAPDYVTLAIRDRFQSTASFHITQVLRTSNDLLSLFERGATQEAVVFEPGFAAKLARGLPARISLVTDASDPNTGSVIQSYAMAVIQGYEREKLGSGVPNISSARTIDIVPQVHVQFNPTLKSSNIFVPGLIAFMLTIIAALMTAISLTREKEVGTMEALLVSPLRPRQIIIGKVAPYIVVGFISVITVLTVGRVIFHVPIRGSLVLLLAEGILFILTSLALGIFISARTSSQRVAMTAALAGTMLPTVLLSGFIFPIESMPLILQWIANLMPAKWFIFIIRGIMLKGVGLRYLWRETIVLAAMAFLLLAMATRSFKVRLE